MHHRYKTGFAGLTLLCLVTQCRKEPAVQPAPSSPSPAVLRFAIGEDPRSLEPGLSILLQDSLIALNLHVGLFAYDKDSVLRPYLVQDRKLSDDRLIWTFILHKNWTWHNGRVITAGDIKQGWERYLDPRLSAWGASYLTSISGAREMLAGSAFSLRGVETPDEHTLKVRLTRPDPLFPLRLGATPTWVAPPEVVLKGEPKWKDQPQGGGPFKLIEWQPRSRIVLEANPQFAGTKPWLDRIEILIVPDPTTALNLYRSGSLDIAPVVASQMRGLRNDPVLRNELHSWPAAQLLFIGLDAQKAAVFRDPQVRQAFTHAIDRVAICEQVLSGAWSPASGMIPTNVPGHSRGPGLAYDPERARELLADAGFPDAREFPALELAVSQDTESTAAEAVAAQLRENLAVDVEVRRVEPGAFYTGLRAHRWGAFLTGWTADYLSAEQWLFRLLYRDQPTNFTGYANPGFDALVDEALGTETEDEQARLWQEANRLATADAALIPLAYGRFAFLVKPGISGFAANVFGPVGFERVRKNSVPSR